VTVRFHPKRLLFTLALAGTLWAAVELAIDATQGEVIGVLALAIALAIDPILMANPWRGRTA
jgi:hypothetical protein